MAIRTKYIPMNKENNFLKCELYYSLGGENCFTGRNEQRGYYVTVYPVEKAEALKVMLLSLGQKCLLNLATERAIKQKRKHWQSTKKRKTTS